jgi:hypothetical protein
MEPSMKPRKPLFDHPMITLAITTLTLSLASAFITFKVIGSRDADPCATVLGRARIEIKQSQVPSVFDAQKWDELTAQYNEVFAECDAETANKFATEEFNPWAAPALEALRPQTSTPAPGSSTPDPAVSPTDTTPTAPPAATPPTSTSPSTTVK